MERITINGRENISRFLRPVRKNREQNRDIIKKGDRKPKLSVISKIESAKKEANYKENAPRSIDALKRYIEDIPCKNWLPYFYLAVPVVIWSMHDLNIPCFGGYIKKCKTRSIKKTTKYNPYYEKVFNSCIIDLDDDKKKIVIELARQVLMAMKNKYNL
jgi:hypothetical protein